MSRRVKQKGVIALVFTLTILAILTIITLFTARLITTDTKIYNNVENNADAYNAAQAGFQYALGYLNANPYAVVGSNAVVNPSPPPATFPGLNFCSLASNTYTPTPASTTLPNGSTYTWQFSCITATNFTTINLIATGTSRDGTSTRTVRATLKLYCGVNQPLIVRGDTQLNNTASVINNVTNGLKTIDAGGTVTLNATASTTPTTSSTLGGSCGTVGSDYISPSATTCVNIRSSNATSPVTTHLTEANLNDANFQTLYLGRTITSFATIATAANTVTCAGGGAAKVFTEVSNPVGANACTIGAGLSTPLISAGNAGKVIYINMTSGTAGGTGRNITFQNSSNGTTATLGTASAPVILAINGANTLTVRSLNSGSSVSTMIVNGNIYANNTGVFNITLGTANDVTTVNGLVFSTERITLNGTAATNGADLNGAIVGGSATDDVLISGTSTDTYSPTTIGNTLGGYCGGAYAVVPGSWRDF